MPTSSTIQTNPMHAPAPKLGLCHQGPQSKELRWHKHGDLPTSLVSALFLWTRSTCQFEFDILGSKAKKTTLNPEKS
eukprot:355662-Amphidinium_carterae.2